MAGAAFAAGAQADLCPQVALQLFKGGAHIGIEEQLSGGGGRAGAARSQSLDLPNGEAASSGTLGEQLAGLRVNDSQQSAAVSSSDVSIFNQVLYRLFKLQEPDGVGDGGSVFAGAVGDIFLSELEIGHQPFKCPRLLEGIEIFALNILNQSDLECLRLGDFADDCGNARQTRALRRSPAALAGNELVAGPVRAQDERLDYAARADRARQFLERFFTKSRPWLIRAWIDQVDVHLVRARQCGCDCSRCGASLRLRLGLPDQGAQAPSQRVSGHWR